MRPSIDRRADRLAGIFDDVAGAAGRADLADDREDDVLGGDALGHRAVHLDQHVLRLALDQGLGGEHVLDLGGADAVRQRAEGAMRRGVAVAADDGHAGQGEALLRADDVDDALAPVGLVEIFDAEIGRVLGQRLDLDAAFLVRDAVDAVGGRRHVVVDDGERALRLRAPCGRPAAGPRRPAGSSPRGRDGGRYRGGRCRPPAGRPDARPRSCRRGCAVWPCRSW